jgi:GT2 family glycosyltransferase
MVREKYGAHIRLISRDVNCGSVKNRNYGAQLAEGNVLFLIDDDTEFPGRKTVSEVIGEFENPCVGAVAIPYLQDGELQQGEPFSSEECFVRASYVGCACAVRRSTFLAHGCYEEFFHHQVEEDDFCLRMLNDGMICIIGRVSEPMVHYESPRRSFFNWDFYGRRNSLLYIWKNCPTLYLFPNLFKTTFSGVSHAIRIRRLRGNIHGLFSGYYAIAKSLFGKGISRHPVGMKCYRLSLLLRKRAMPLKHVSSFMEK